MAEQLTLVDENDRKLGKTAPYDEVVREGLWHRGAYIIITSTDGRVILQKRSSGLEFYPGEVEMSVGGSVSAYETPESTIRREVEEELGIQLPAKSLVFLGKYKFNHGNRRNFIYSYTADIPTTEIEFKPAASEVSDVFSLTVDELKKDLVKRCVDGVGEIAPIFGFWKFLVKGIEKPMPLTRVHFVCRGNTFRSRIAETIVNAKELKNFKASSSGIEADTSIIISPWADRVLSANHLSFTTQSPHKPDIKNLNKSDVTVVMSEDVFRDADYLHGLNPIVWDVVDIDSRANGDLADLNDLGLQEAAEQVFSEIDYNINKLLDQLAKSAIN